MLRKKKTWKNIKIFLQDILGKLSFRITKKYQLFYIISYHKTQKKKCDTEKYEKINLKIKIK